MNLALTNNTVEGYFRLLSRLDNASKKKLAVRLIESIQVEKEKDADVRNLAGAWEDDRDSDEIIQQIRNSRIEKSHAELL
ncbi:MAG: hypothetical protein ACK5LR_08635 [Mangrovibacterium sp.]